MQILLPILLSLLSNEKLLNLIIGIIADWRDRPDNDVDEEFTDAQLKALRLRLNQEAPLLKGNIFLPDKELKRIKAKRVGKPT